MRNKKVNIYWKIKTDYFRKKAHLNSSLCFINYHFTHYTHTHTHTHTHTLSLTLLNTYELKHTQLTLLSHTHTQLTLLNTYELKHTQLTQHTHTHTHISLHSTYVHLTTRH